MSQRARAIETWAIFASRGRNGVAELVDQLCDLARLMAARLHDGGVEMLVPTALNQVLVAFGNDETTEQVIAAVQEDGRCWVGGTEWQGRYAMRVSICDSSTSPEDVEAASQAILEARDQVLAAGHD
jgi:glutamate/tyrosine decarboxylase-like PLP-dependent enzyme